MPWACTFDPSNLYIKWRVKPAKNVIALQNQFVWSFGVVGRLFLIFTVIFNNTRSFLAV